MALVLAVMADPLETKVIPASDLRTRVPMVTLFYLRNDPRARVRAGDFVVTEVQDGSMTALGRDKAGKPWRAQLPATTDGLWRGDFNGTSTYYFAGRTAANGIAPDTWILVLSFDRQGRPVPFCVRGYSNYDSEGIPDVLNLDGTGPELVQQDWVETGWMPEIRSGYWMTTLYQQRGFYWYRANGRHGSRTFPLYEKWAVYPKMEPELVDAPGLAFSSTDYGNDPRSGVQSRVLSVREDGIRTGPDLGCELQSVSLVVRDFANGRQIELGYDAVDTPRLLRGIAREHLRATFTGLDRWPGTNLCDASAAWVTIP